VKASARPRDYADVKNRSKLTALDSTVQKSRNYDSFVDYDQLMKSLHRFGPAFGPILMVIWIVFLMWLLQSTADVFFVPPLVYLAKLLQLSPEVSGATLVALGNGIPDLCNSLSVGIEASDVPLALNNVFGGLASMLGIVGGIVVIASQKPTGSSERALAEGAGGSAQAIYREACYAPAASFNGTCRAWSWIQYVCKHRTRASQEWNGDAW